MKIEFYTLDAGWIDGQMRVNDIHYYFNYSWISHFLDDLLKGLLYIDGHLLDNGYFDTFTAYVEPAIDDWKLTKKGNCLQIEIQSFEDESRKELIEQVVVECNYYVFVQSLIDGLVSLLKRIGLYGYYVEWNEEFPLSLLLKLYDIIQPNERLNLQTLSLEETQGRGGSASDLSIELNLLKDIINDE
ncbi:hypothetical protein [Longibaculum muris]|uniref:hypothetical protein n=1 Tax=Longibaculum muris TaxID=1796628 RepID=UPI0012B8C36B|nr:hypothetical protein [Longibaculum muris]